MLEMLRDVALPAVTAAMGWFASIWRSRQKKEKDILENVTQILEMQKSYIAEQDERNRKLDRKLDDKRRSISQANWCEYVSKGGGCPVLIHEHEFDIDSCDTCEHNLAKDDNGKA